MPIKDDETETEEDTDACTELNEAVAAVVEHIDEALTKLDDIDRDDLRNRHHKRLDKAKDKLEVAKKALEKLVET